MNSKTLSMAVVVASLALTLSALDGDFRKCILIAKGDYIIGDIYRAKEFEKHFANAIMDPYIDNYFRNINLSDDFCISRSEPGHLILFDVNKVKYETLAKSISQENDPYKYAKRDSILEAMHASFKEAKDYCTAKGGRIPRDYEIEIGLKYYELNSGGARSEPYFEFAIDKAGKPILLKYYFVKLDAILKDIEPPFNKLEMMQRRISLENENEPIAASVRCVWEEK